MAKIYRIDSHTHRDCSKMRLGQTYIGSIVIFMCLNICFLSHLSTGKCKKKYVFDMLICYKLYIYYKHCIKLAFPNRNRKFSYLLVVDMKVNVLS